MIHLRLLLALILMLSGFRGSAWAFTPNAQEAEIANRMKSASGQQRATLIFDSILSEVARARAADMARRGYFSHENPDGHGVNYLVRQAGYVLPDWYPSDGNNLESIAAGGSSASITWGDWMGSPDHKRHILGEETFFRDQTAYGIGFVDAPGSRYRYYWVILTAPPMPRTATVLIDSPAANAAVPEGAVTISGTAEGSPEAAAVQYSIQGSAGTSAWATASGVARWSANVSGVSPGANTLRVRSLNSGGSVLAETARPFQYVVVRPITVRIVGQGTVERFAGTTYRRVGVDYTLTATPAPGWIFSGWSGSWSGSAATVTLTMRQGLDATATFVENPFLTRRGSYSGLLADSRGSLRLQLNAFGKVTGQLFFAGQGYSATGQFRLNGRATIRIPRANASPLVLVLDLNGPNGALLATVLDGPNANSFTLGPIMRARASALAGRYTISLPASRSNVDDAVPKGDGFGVLSVSGNGTATLAAVLADGTAFSRGAWIDEAGALAFYTPLYNGAGALGGTLTFQESATSDIAGALLWNRPAIAAAARFADGFESAIAAAGARYLTPAAGQMVLSAPPGNGNVRLIFGAGNFIGEINQSARLTVSDQILISSPSIAGISASVDAVSGTFRGVFLHPRTSARTPFRGVILQKRNAGVGFFMGSSQSGYAEFTPAP